MHSWKSPYQFELYSFRPEPGLPIASSTVGEQDRQAGKNDEDNNVDNDYDNLNNNSTSLLHTANSTEHNKTNPAGK